jgi:uncharacterized membrane protein
MTKHAYSVGRGEEVIMWVLWIVAFFAVLLLIGVLTDRRRRRGTGTSSVEATGRPAHDMLGDPNVATTMAYEKIIEIP